MSGTFEKDLSRQIREIGLIQRRNGHQEFRLAAMRMFEKLKMYPQATAVGLMEVDNYLTDDEIAERDKMP
jgi:hypothetical protein